MKCPSSSRTTSREPGSSSRRMRRALDRRHRVVRPPDEQRRDAECREAPLVGSELVEVARAVEHEMRGAALVTVERLPAGVDRLVVHPRDPGERGREPVARDAGRELLALPGRAQHLREPVPLAEREEAGSADDEPAHQVRVVAGPAHPDQPAPVVHAEHDRAELELGVEAPERRDVRLPGAGLSACRAERRVAEPGQVGRERTPAGTRGGGQHRLPHVRGLGIPVHAQERARRRAGRERLAIGQSGGGRGHGAHAISPRMAGRHP